MIVTDIQTGKCKGRSCFLQVVVYLFGILFIFDLLVESEYFNWFVIFYLCMQLFLFVILLIYQVH